MSKAARFSVSAFEAFSVYFVFIISETMEGFEACQQNETHFGNYDDALDTTNGITSPSNENVQRVQQDNIDQQSAASENEMHTTTK